MSTEELFNNPPENPIVVLQDWMAQARANNVVQPGALALATSDVNARCSNRIVQINEIGDKGIIFATHAQSQKGKDFAATGWASGLFYWRETNQQIMVSGPVVEVPAEQSDRLWEKRPKSLLPMSVASNQSEILEDEDELRRKADEIAKSTNLLARPNSFRGYALRPVVIEFWQAAADRLHLRLRYDAVKNGWKSCRLQP